MNDIESRARELLAESLRASYPDDIARRQVIRQLLADELDFISARVAVKVLVAALTPPEGYVLVRREAIDWLNGEGDFECPPDRYFRGAPPRYWWRSVFREKAGLSARPEVSP